MLRIGEFSAITGMSISMLRNYDKIGLLVPVTVDEINNYRYYNENQIILANRIQILRELGFSLKNIYKIVNTDDNGIAELIEKNITEKEKEKQILEEQIKNMKQAIDNLKSYSEFVFDVKIGFLPKRKVISIRENISKFEDEGLLWNKLYNECTKNNIKTINNGYSYAITHSVDLSKNIIDTEVQVLVEDKLTNLNDNQNNIIKYSELPKIKTAIISIKGAYNRISDISSYVYKFIKNSKYQIYGPPIRKYYISPNDTNNTNEFITEYFYPLKE